MTTPDNKPQNELEILTEAIRADMLNEGLTNLSAATIDRMASIILGVRHAQTAGDIRELLGDSTNPLARTHMRSIPHNDTPLNDDATDQRTRRTTAQILAEDAFGNGQHAQSPRLIPYCAKSAARPSGQPKGLGKSITGPSI